MYVDQLLYLNSSDTAEACADIDPLRHVAQALRQHAEGAARVGDEGTLRCSPAEGRSARTPGGTARGGNEDNQREYG